MTRSTLLFCALLGACTGNRQAPEEPTPAIDAAPRRSPSPPAKVHAYPPHAIRSDGVGPYILGEPMRQVLRELPEGPHLELVQVGKYANWRVTRVEGGAIVVGAESGEVSFVSVLRPDVAKTSDGIEVGSTGAGLRPAEVGVLRDRQVLEHPSLPGVAFLTDAAVDAPREEAHVIGVVVTPRPKAAASDAGSGCVGLGAPPAEIVAAAKLRLPATAPLVRPACVTGSPTGDAFVVGEGELVLVGGEPGKLKRLAAAPMGPADFAGAIDLDGDRRDELIVGAQRREQREHAVTIHVLRWDAGKLVEVATERPFAISEGAAAAAGVTPEQIDLCVEVRPARGGLQVGGYYMARRDGILRELAPLQPVTLRIEMKKPTATSPPAPVDAAGISVAEDAGP